MQQRKPTSSNEDPVQPKEKKKKKKHFNGKRKSKAKEEIQKVHFNPHNKNLIYLGYKKLLQSNKKREIEN